MSSGLSDAWANAKLNNEFRLASITLGTSIWVALTTTLPAAGVPGTEVAGGSYARIEMPLNTTTWSLATAREIANLIAVVFAPATGSWGTIQGWQLMDAVSGGNVRWFGALGTPKPIGSGDTFSIPVGQMKLRDNVT